MTTNKESASLALARHYLGKTVTVTVDRPLGSKHPKHGFIYGMNYGYIEGVIAPDGEGLDAYVLGVSEPVAIYKGTCIAVVHRRDDDDDKLVVAPDGMAFTDEEILRAVDFQERWFDTVIVR